MRICVPYVGEMLYHRNNKTLKATGQQNPNIFVA